MRYEKEVIYNGQKLYAVYEYHEGEKEIRYDSNNTGTPGYDPYVELIELWAICKDSGGKDHCVEVSDLFSADDFINIEDDIMETK